VRPTEVSAEPAK